MQDAAEFAGKKTIFDNLTANANFLFDAISDEVDGKAKVRIQMVAVSNIGSRLIDNVSTL